MQKIEFNVFDLGIKILPDGQTEVVQIVPRLAFNEAFIKAMKEQGVLNMESRQTDEE